jgi:hypothetical protein
MYWMQKHFAPPELEVVDEGQAINMSLLRSYQTTSSYVELTLNMWSSVVSVSSVANSPFRMMMVG